MNKYMIIVMEELKNDLFFYKSNNLLLYTVSNSKKELGNEMFCEKINAVRNLNNLGALKIHNKGKERIPETTTYEFQILIIQPAFDGIYKKCIKEITGQGLEQYENQIQTKKNAPALLKKLTLFITVNKITKKQAQFLKLLSDFEPKPINDLTVQIKVKDMKDLKKRVQKKIKGSGFSIKTHRNKSSFKRGAYQLIYIPPDF